MWKNGHAVETFTGHNDVVKEFVWRKGGQGQYSLLVVMAVLYQASFTGGDGFQLITWSKDRTLKFWPIDSETMQVQFVCLQPSS